MADQQDDLDITCDDCGGIGDCYCDVPGVDNGQLVAGLRDHVKRLREQSNTDRAEWVERLNKLGDEQRTVVVSYGQYGGAFTLPPCGKCGSRDSILERRYANSQYLKTKFIWRCADCSWPFECDTIHLR